MRKTVRIQVLLLCVAIMFIMNADLMAQCAMCRAVAESNTTSGGSFASGLNKGILYLMGIPYLAIFGAIFYIMKQKGYKLIWKSGPKLSKPIENK